MEPDEGIESGLENDLRGAISKIALPRAEKVLNAEGAAQVGVRDGPTLVRLHERVDVRVTATAVEVFHRGQRVAAHRRSVAPGHHTTLPEHMPKAHQAHATWRPSRFVDWATTIGPQTAALVTAILADRPHPEQGYRSCLGILRLAKRYDPARLEAACGRARRRGALLPPRRRHPQARPRSRRSPRSFRGPERARGPRGWRGRPASRRPAPRARCAPGRAAARPTTR
jgi:Mu transposase-like protein